VLRRLLAELRPYRLQVALLFLLWTVGVPLALLEPVPGKLVLDSVLNNEPVPGYLAAALPASMTASKEAVLRLAFGLVVAVVIVKQLQGATTSLLSTWLGQNLVLRFRSRIFRHVQHLSLAYHDSRGVASALHRIEHDARAVETVALEGVIPLVTAVLTLLAMAYVTARLDWRLALIALSVAPLLLLLTHASTAPLRRQWRRVKDIESSLTGVVQEVLSAVRVVKAFGQEAREARRYDLKAVQGLKANLRVTASQGLLGLLLSAVIAVGTGAVLYVGARHVQQGLLTTGDLILVLFYLAMLYGPLETISSKLALLQGALVSAGRAFELLDLGTELPERSAPMVLVKARGAVVFRDVSFQYPDGAPILDHVSFEAPPGSLVGIAGEIGAGKTTLLNLLPRFYDPTEGMVLLDGVDLRDYRIRDVRNQFAIVPQDPLLFSTTIAENIAYGRPDATEQEILAAARQANAEEFVRRLPEGFHSAVGERGMFLSTGQRQLISLARAFLRDAPLLILDEPTSAVDTETESMVMDALRRLIVGRTVFMVAHRLHTLHECDLILFLKNGRLIDPPALVRKSIARG
jgi:ATP-binding cassette subfamily B protein